MPAKRREKIEEKLIQPSTRLKREDYKRQEQKEKAAVEEKRISKYAMDFVAGSLLQLTSFGIGGFATIGTGNPLLFPVVVPLMNEWLGEKLAQLTRSSTIVIPETQQWFAIQCQLAHALGDLFVRCANKDPSKKFDIKVNDEIKKVTAAEALKHMGLVGGFKAWGKNFLVRGLPFAWFSALYGVRDWQLYDAHGGYFSGNATKWCHSFTPNANCTNVEQPTGSIDPATMRILIVFAVGMLARAATSLTGQLIASQLAGAEEKPNFSTDCYVKKLAYLESLKDDIKKYIDNLSPIQTYEYETELFAAIDLEKSIDKDISYVKNKSSLWTTYKAEMNLASQKKRDSTMVTPEFGGKRIDMGMSIIGKMLSLIAYTGIIQKFSPQIPQTSEQDQMLSLILPPLLLIFIAGFAHRDDLRLIPQTMYGATKGMVRACKRSAKHVSENVHSTQAENDNVVDMKGALQDVRVSEEEKEPNLSSRLTNPDGTPVKKKARLAAKLT